MKIDRACFVLADGFSEWLLNFRNSSASTVKLRRSYLLIFFEFVGEKWTSSELSLLSSKAVETWFVSYCQDRGQGARRSMQATLRLFFRYCFASGIIAKDLSPSIPSIRTYKLSSVPRGISEEAAHRVLKAVNRATAVGQRDYAILCLLYHYGVRAKQICALSLSDIRWREDKIVFNALKHGKTVAMPLLPKIGQALLDYLEHGRPTAQNDHVFLTVTKPHRALGDRTTVSEIVARYIRKLHLETSSKGARLFRHSFAQRMLREGNSIKSIADCLGHTSIQTTTIYAKVDFSALRHVALELPTEEEV